jgi:predicted Zn finger-like uncharacterized protein
MNLACPECSTVYRLDPERIPDEGVATRCRSCGTLFRVDAEAQSPGDVLTAPRVEGPTRENGSGGEPRPAPDAAAPAVAAERRTSRPSSPAFGPQDPDTRARRLARALVSDITVYNPAKWEQSLQSGTLRSDFRDEILKSWGEYVEQVGESMAKRTPHFREALNDILARGGQVF